jgi:hypothetical protein
MFGAASSLVPLLSSSSEPLRMAAFSATLGFARNEATAIQLVMAGGIPPVIAALRSPTAFLQAAAAEMVNWIARADIKQVSLSILSVFPVPCVKYLACSM